MATRCMVAIENPNGTIQGIYVHYDGYPLGVGVNLLKGFNTIEAGDQLIELGSLRTLEENLEKTIEKNQLSENQEAEEYFFDNRKEFFSCEEEGSNYGPLGTEYAYLQDMEGTWHVRRYHEPAHGIIIADKVADNIRETIPQLDPKIREENQDFFAEVAELVAA